MSTKFKQLRLLPNTKLKFEFKFKDVYHHKGLISVSSNSITDFETTSSIYELEYCKKNNVYSIFLYGAGYVDYEKIEKYRISSSDLL